MATRDTKFLLKRSNVPGKIPPSSAMTEGEIALKRTQFGVGPEPKQNAEGLFEIADDVIVNFALQASPEYR